MLLIPEAAWARMLSELARHDAHAERVAYLDGIRTGTVPSDAEDGLTALAAAAAVVTTVTFPNAA